MVFFVSADLSQRLAPDGLWDLVAPLLSSFVSRPQDGGTAPLDERAVFTDVVYVLTGLDPFLRGDIRGVANNGSKM